MVITRKFWYYAIGGLVAGLLLGVVWGLFHPQSTSAPTVNSTVTTNTNTVTNSAPTNTALAGVAAFSTLDLPDRDSAFDFTANIPTAWAVEYVAASQAINVYDPRGSGESSLANSKIFIKFFSANTFQTLTTVDIRSRIESTIADRPAVTYVIQKKAGVAKFSDQPDWRNNEHRVTDIRSSNSNPATFYVFAKSPEVSDVTFDAFLGSLKFTTEIEASVVYPLKDFLARISKKRFGQFITPQNSPVSPERFSGYHTGVDAEATSSEAGTDVPVYAVAAGTVVLRQVVAGYGGVVMIESTVQGTTITTIFGHLDIASVALRVGDTVTVGQTLGVLGAGGTDETDGERQHLHFGVLIGTSTNLKGYVSKREDLTPWLDPVNWLSNVGAVEMTTV